MSYSFPSKTSSYVLSGAKILAICGENTSVANWIKHNNLGFVIPPKIPPIVDFFFKIENGNINSTKINTDRSELKKRLHIDMFVKNLKLVIFPIKSNE